MTDTKHTPTTLWLIQFPDGTRAFLDSEPAEYMRAYATAYSAPAASQPAQGVGLTDELREALSDAKTGHGSYGPNYDGNKLAASISAILARQTAPTLPKAQIDSIVYQCRQSGDDSTYAIVNAALAAACQTAPTLDSAPQANRADFERLWLDEQENMTPAQIEAAWSAWQVAAGKSAPQQPAASRAAVPDGYGETDFGYTFAGIHLEDGDKRLMAMLVKAFGTDHPAVDDLTALLFRSRAAAPSPAPVAQEGADAGALALACVINKKLGDVLAGRAYLLPPDLAALKRFHECATDFDSGGHDVPKDMMARLREIGVVQSLGFGRHQTTAFGDYVLERDAGDPVKLPLKTMADRNEDSRQAALDAAQQTSAQVDAEGGA